AAAVGDITRDIRPFAPDALAEALEPGDVVVSMLPGEFHVPLARLAIAHGAHFVSSSYISPEMKALDAEARAAGVALVNEVGLDPGIDHLMAHWLVDDYRNSAAEHPDNELSFISYCGGVPKVPNALRYKFSWSPLGVLKALGTPARAVEGGSVQEFPRPWEAVSEFVAPLARPEVFEVYPNRNSVPFIEQYGFSPEWKIRRFVRGTLRLKGWKDAWTPIFEEIEESEASPDRDETLGALSERLWEENAYGEGEPDRVVLVVSLEAVREGRTVYHKSWVLDAWGDERGSAMARLVSVPVALAVEAVLDGRIGPGVSAAPSDPVLVAEWLDVVAELAQHLELVDHLESEAADEDTPPPGDDIPI
ncbi:MAG: saccharopine dehydrogenase, partial [Alphaproteobacteria bacterium]